MITAGRMLKPQTCGCKRNIVFGAEEFLMPARVPHLQFRRRGDEMIIEATYDMQRARYEKSLQSAVLRKNVAARRARSTVVHYRVTGSFGIGRRGWLPRLVFPATGRRAEVRWEGERNLARINEIGGGARSTMYARSRYTLCTVIYTYVTVIKMQIFL